MKLAGFPTAPLDGGKASARWLVSYLARVSVRADAIAADVFASVVVAHEARASLLVGGCSGE